MGRKRKAPEPEESPEGGQQAENSMSGSGQGEEAGSSPTEAGPSSDESLRVNPTRYREMKAGEIKKGPVIYWYIDCEQHASHAYQPTRLAPPTFLVLAFSKLAHNLSISVKMWLVAGCQEISV